MKKIILLAVSFALIAVPSIGQAKTCFIVTNCNNVYINCGTNCGSCSMPTKHSYAVGNETLYQQLRGSIIMLSENNGEAYYVHPNNHQVYYLGNSINALQILQSFGQGMYNRDLDRIQTGLLHQYGADSDMDGLSNQLEEALGTDKYNFNTDHDTFSDKIEILYNYSPLRSGKLAIDLNFSRQNKGKILLQAERQGQAWYINPKDNRKYLLSNQYEIADIINNFAIGISNYNFRKLVK